MNASSFSPMQLAALEDLYLATNGVEWTYVALGAEWDFSQPEPDPCAQGWQGISCDANGELVTSLRLTGFNLRGSLPQSLSSLSSLVTLVLGGNSLTGEIPDLAPLSKLTQLDLADNALSGPFPEGVYAMRQLFVLDLCRNRLTGPLPLSLDAHTSLFLLSLHINLFTGSVPYSLVANKPQLQILNINDNLLTGEVPTNFFSLSRLQTLSLHNNALSGPLAPWAMNNQTSVSTFSIYGNFFTGAVPPRRWRSLSYYYADHNLLSQLDCSLAQSKRLRELIFGFNLLSGSLPACVEEMTSLSILNMMHNALEGTLSASLFSRVRSLVAVYFDSNRLHGTLPATLSNCTSLFAFTASYNALTGTLPLSLSKLGLLGQLMLQGNALSGRIDTLFDRGGGIGLPALLVADLSDNQFTGPLPQSFFANNSQIQSFAAASNCFTGSLPRSVCTTTRLIALSLDGLSTASSCRVPLFPALSFLPQLDAFTVRDAISAGLPQCYFSIPRLRLLHLSGNALSGSLPQSVSPSLLSLSLSHNLLTGTLPETLLNRYWTSLDLSYNKLGGSLLSLRTESFQERNSSLSLSVNRLSGPVPAELRAAPFLSLLTGNVFSCDVARTHLPAHDEASERYACGSDEFNAALYLWMCALLLPLCVWLLIEKKVIRRERMRSVSLSLCSDSARPSSLSLTQIHVHTRSLSLSLAAQEESSHTERNYSSESESESENHDDKQSFFLALSRWASRCRERAFSAYHSIFAWQQIFDRFKFKRVCNDSNYCGNNSKTTNTNRNNSNSQSDSRYDRESKASVRFRFTASDAHKENFHFSLSNCFLFHSTMRSVRTKTLLISLLILCVLLPIYCALTVRTHTYEFQYAWQLSAAFVTGRTAAIVLAVSLSLFFSYASLLCVRMIEALRRERETRISKAESVPDIAQRLVSVRVFSQEEHRTGRLGETERDEEHDASGKKRGSYNPEERTDEKEKGEEGDEEVEDSERDSAQSDARSTMANGHSTASLSLSTPRPSAFSSFIAGAGRRRARRPHCLLWTVWLLSFVLNLAIMLSLDVLYIYAVLNFNGWTVTLAQIGVALAKLVWNDSLVFHALFLLKKQLLSLTETEEERRTRLSHVQSHFLSTRDVTTLSLLATVNKIVVPCVAIALVNTNCFYNALFAAPAVKANIEFCNANVQGIPCTNLLASRENGETYDPPFLYSYQCSSFFLADYAPVFVYMCAFSSIFLPFFLFSLQNVHDSLADDILFTEFQRVTSPTDAHSLTLTLNDSANKIDKNKDTYARALFDFLSDWLPQTWQCPLALSASQIENKSTLIAIVNTKQRTTIRVNNHFALLLSFAVLCPPLALVALVSVCVLTYFEERNTARLLSHAHAFEKRWLAERIEKECVGVNNSFRFTLSTSVLLGAVLGASFVFDAMGDEHGWRPALGLAFSVIAAPLLIWIYWFASRRTEEDASTMEVDSEAVEMAIWKDSTLSQETTTFVNPLYSHSHSPDQ